MSIVNERDIDLYESTEGLPEDMALEVQRLTEKFVREMQMVERIRTKEARDKCPR